MLTVPFNIPYTTKESVENVQRLVLEPVLLNQRYFSNACIKWLETVYTGYKAFLTPSATQALELLACSLEIKPGDEIIMPSFNYVGVAAAFVNHGATIVFTDIDSQTMCLEVDEVEKAITDKTKAIVVTNYNGVSYKLKTLEAICKSRNILLIEDNAQGINCMSKDQMAGTHGDFSCISFDPLKNISANEGGVLLCKEKWVDKISVHYENGTNKQAFIAGKINAYQWIDKGSRYFMSEYNAAILYPLLLQSKAILNERKQKWLALINAISTHPSISCLVDHFKNYPDHNAHIAYVKLKTFEDRNALIKSLAAAGIQSSFHYVPLHNSPAGKLYGRCAGQLIHTEKEADRLLRLPMHNYLTDDQIDYIVDELGKAL
ncbi:MAG: aminotransferase class V-fold PLP-dependent enzyme [Chitinophagales bacterium]